MGMAEAAENIEIEKRIIIMIIDEMNKVDIHNSRKDLIIKNIGKQLSVFNEFVKKNGNPNIYKEI